MRVFDDRQKAVCSMQYAEGSKQCAVTVGKTLEGVEFLFRSPGFRLTHPLILQAKERGIPITSSTRYFLEHCGAKTIGITGSNGKTTCSTLIARFLAAEYPGRVHEGGNDRVPRLDLLEGVCGGRGVGNLDGINSVERGLKPTANKGTSSLAADFNPRSAEFIPQSSQENFVVLELSSFQLIDCPVSPHVAVILNCTPNHLDWHADMAEYAEAKRQIVAHQEEGDIAILNPDDPIIRTFAEGLRSTVRWFDEDVPLDDVLCKSHPTTIRAAVTAARSLGVSAMNIQKVLREFPGVPQRLEFIRELHGVQFFNDSSCTTPESAITACQAFPMGKIVLLLGGRDKNMDFTRLYEVIKERKVRVVPYGEMAPRFAQALPRKSQILNPQSQDFAATIRLAQKSAVSGDNVVLSPACASFDMFQNAKERGRIFEESVRALS